ncbi:MAG TPA: hypothetical protein VNN18_07660 [Candidatus Xenobia bacterium]|nr:hypothetical protein [Candidatus Xenobia bacterium]
MRNRNALALLLSPLLFLALFFFTADNGVQASPHPESYYRNGDYARSVAVVWALDSIKDGVSCHDSLLKYEREVRGVYRYDRDDDREYRRDYRRGWRGDARDAIASTYEDLAGRCTDHDPHSAARRQAAFYLEGLRVDR